MLIMKGGKQGGEDERRSKFRCFALCTVAVDIIVAGYKRATNTGNGLQAGYKPTGYGGL